MTRAGRRCTQCAALTLSIAAALFTANAYAQAGNALSQVSTEFWLGIFFTVLFALLAGNNKSLSDRQKLADHELKQQQAQINMLSERVLREHPSRTETAEHRAHVESQLQHIRERLDMLARPHHRREDDR